MSTNKNLLEAKDVNVAFGGLRALSEVNLTVGNHEVVGLIGPNGAGKTTMFNTICGIVKPDSGTLTIEGEETPWPATDQLAGIGIAGVVPQMFAYSAEVGEDTHTGRNMAKVVGITYAGVLAGPAIIGFLTALVPLNIAIGLGVVLGLFTALGTLVIEKRNANAKTL